MILEGNEVSWGRDLALHLMNPRENDHVTLHAVDGFMADDLAGAFAEAQAVAQATQCQNYLFSLSLNPPIGPDVTVEVFEDAIAKVERKLGLVGQPRAVVFHEKNGRRHAHCVWSRIDGTKLQAIELPHYKRKLGDVSREIYLTQDWDMPNGFRDRANRDPLNVRREEAQQAARTKRDPKALKRMFRQCWDASDSKAAFAAALKEQGYLLARGDRRGFVAVDGDGKIWSLSRWCGVKPKELRARLGSEADLPSVEDVVVQTGQLPTPPKTIIDPAAEARRTDLVARQRSERTALLGQQKDRRLVEMRLLRMSRPKGLRATFLKAIGRYQDSVQAAAQAAQAAQARDRAEQHDMIQRHLAERRALMHELQREGLAAGFKSAVAHDPRQALHQPADDLPLTTQQLLRNPALILAEISKTKATFDRTVILRALARKIDDPFALKDAADTALASPEIVRSGSGKDQRFTTRDFVAAGEALDAACASMMASRGFGVADRHVTHAIRAQNTRMKRAFGGALSTEQKDALRHILGQPQCAFVLGLAGAGKSTLLATAKEAWDLQGVRVHGAALAGKAADGLESASGIQSRTLASLEASWENGYAPIAKGDVLVIDEAGMIGTRQLARVATKVQEIGAKLVLVGDPDQLQPIEAGVPFRDLVERHGAAWLTEIHRQRVEWQRDASRDLASGDIAKAVETYAAQGTVAQEKTRDVALAALVEAYTMDVAANGAETSRLAFTYRRKDVHALNQAIRGALRETEDAPPETLLMTDTGPRAFAPGDRIVFGRNDREMGLRNGSLGTVEAVGKTLLKVTLDGDPKRTVTLDPRRYQNIDHGYAVTIHKSQGATVDHAYVLASRSMDRHLAYVSMTRHRDALQVYVSRDDAPHWAMTHQPRTQTRSRDGPHRSGPSLG